MSCGTVSHLQSKTHDIKKKWGFAHILNVEIKVKINWIVWMLEMCRGALSTLTSLTHQHHTLLKEIMGPLHHRCMLCAEIFGHICGDFTCMGSGWMPALSSSSESLLTSGLVLLSDTGSSGSSVCRARRYNRRPSSDSEPANAHHSSLPRTLTHLPLYKSVSLPHRGMYRRNKYSTSMSLCVQL